MSDNKKDTELSALVRLLDEPDNKMYEQIRKKIFSYGTDAIPVLEDAWENSFNNTIQQRIENIIHRIQLEDLYDEMQNWAKFGNDDLLKGFILVSKFQYPDLDEDMIMKKIGRISQDIWLELNPDLTALEKIKVINHVLFDIYKFKGNKTSSKAPENYYINNILETKKGNPLSLGMLYIVLARSLKIPISGVDLPQHFILSYSDQVSYDTESGQKTEKVLFYINPFNKGALFTQNEIELYLKQMGLSHKDVYFIPCSHSSIIRRVLNELIKSHEKAGNTEKVEEIKFLLQSLD
jgi:regulator of sirC expression with transglutaminase-like and TPR domain